MLALGVCHYWNNRCIGMDNTLIGRSFLNASIGLMRALFSRNLEIVRTGRFCVMVSFLGNKPFNQSEIMKVRCHLLTSVVKQPLPTWLGLILTVALLVGVGVSRAHADVNERELQAAERKIESLLHEAGLLQERGKRDAAEAHRREAESLQKRLADFYAERERRQDDDLRSRREEKKHAAQREREQSGRDRERAEAHEQLEIMRIALRGLEEGEKGDLADMMRRAIRAREVVLEGGRGREVAELREQSPSRGALAEILGVASSVWAEFGHEKESELVGRLSRSVGASVRERQNLEGDKRREDREERELDRARERQTREEREEHRSEGEQGEVRSRKIVRERDGHRETEIIRELEGRGERRVEREIVRERGHGGRDERRDHPVHRIELIERRLEAIRTMMESLQEDLHELKIRAVEEHH